MEKHSKHSASSHGSKHSGVGSHSKAGSSGVSDAGSQSKSGGSGHSKHCGEESHSESGDRDSKKKVEKRKDVAIEEEGISFDTSGTPKRAKNMEASIKRKMNYDKFKMKKKTERVREDSPGPALESNEGETSYELPPPPKNVKITEQDILGYLSETHAHYRPVEVLGSRQKQGNELDLAKVGLK